MIDVSVPRGVASISLVEIKEVDAMLRAIQLLRHSEQARARDRGGVLVGRLDPDGKKFGAFSLGLLDGVRTIAGGENGILKLLAYLLMLCETDPGRAPEAAERILSLERHENLRSYVDRGRQTVFDVVMGVENGPGGFARLLLSEISSCTAH